MVDFKKGAEELLNVLPLLEGPGEPGREGEEVWRLNRTSVTLSYYGDRWHSLPCADGVCMAELTAPEYVRTRDQAITWLRIEMYQTYLQTLREDAAALQKFKTTPNVADPMPDATPTMDFKQGVTDLLSVIPLVGAQAGTPARAGEVMWNIGKSGVSLSYYVERWHSLIYVSGVLWGEPTAPADVQDYEDALKWLQGEIKLAADLAGDHGEHLELYRASKAQTVSITSPLPDDIPTKDFQNHSAVVYGTSGISIQTPEEQFEALLSKIQTNPMRTMPKGYEMKVTCVLRFVMPDNAVLNVHFEEIGAILEREEYPVEITLKSGKTYFPCCIPHSATDDVVENILSLRLWRRLVKQNTPLDELIRESMESGEAVPWDPDDFMAKMDAQPYVMNKGRHISLSLGTARLLAQNGEQVENLT